MRLIDADEVIETLLTTDDVEGIFLDLAQNRRLDYLHDVEESDVVDFARDIIKVAIGVINTSPTIDAIEIIRCGKCIHFDTDWAYCGSDVHYCKKHKYARRESEFCSDGQRKDYNE